MTRADNLPDDWDTYRRTCSECGENYHESGADECRCTECERCGHRGPSDDGTYCDDCAAHIDDGWCIAPGCDEQSCDRGDGKRCWEHVVEELEADLVSERARTKALADELAAARKAATVGSGDEFKRGYRRACESFAVILEQSASDRRSFGASLSPDSETARAQASAADLAAHYASLARTLDRLCEVTP